MIKKRVLCDHCRGSGAATDGDIHSCPECGGSGVRIVKQQIFPGMFAQSQVTCNKCSGRGRIIVRECPACSGQKVLDHTAQFTLDVPRGAPEGHEVVFEGEGDESPDWEPGDVVLRVRSRAEKGGLRRKESSLYWKETIGVDEVRLSYSKQFIYRTYNSCGFLSTLSPVGFSLSFLGVNQALLGFTRNFTHLDGHVVPLVRKGVTQPGFVQTIKGEGMPLFERPTSHGDLFVEYNVVLPTKLSEETRQSASCRLSPNYMFMFLTSQLHRSRRGVLWETT
jgi:DnaJ-related protein SCJ1